MPRSTLPLSRISPELVEDARVAAEVARAVDEAFEVQFGAMPKSVLDPHLYGREDWTPEAAEMCGRAYSLLLMRELERRAPRYPINGITTGTGPTP